MISLYTITQTATNNIKKAGWFPVDTGFLRDIGTNFIIRGNTSEIFVDKVQAFYFDFLNNGTINSTKHINFWNIRAFESAVDTIIKLTGGVRIR
jgi:hypothetical protein